MNGLREGGTAAGREPTFARLVRTTCGGGRRSTSGRRLWGILMGLGLGLRLRRLHVALCLHLLLRRSSSCFRRLLHPTDAGEWRAGRRVRRVQGRLGGSRRNPVRLDRSGCGRRECRSRCLDAHAFGRCNSGSGGGCRGCVCGGAVRSVRGRGFLVRRLRCLVRLTRSHRCAEREGRRCMRAHAGRRRNRRRRGACSECGGVRWDRSCRGKE